MHDQNKENQEALLMDAEYELSESLSPVQREEFNIEVLYEQLAFNTSRSMSSTGGEAQEVIIWGFYWFIFGFLGL
jgi:hypothetical protein